MSTLSRLPGAVLAAAFALGLAAPALAYDGTNCKEPGVCWEPKPGYPEKAKLAGSKYDPKHDPKQVAKQGDSIKAMEERNKKRADNFAKTGKFQYDVSKIAN
ncbi:methanol dehydrogenase [Hansschlegelia sp. KR7-227]|jgi:methanol dehydrogenase (cytochrome c) subunit 2|uniref:methanol dehydrogenase n=1 Tax=Hansschlegelia sp. KR7-227 TaxID=3400914 RepID=UPI003BFE30A3